MPILPSEPCLFPDDLFEATERIEQGRRWWAIYTLSRREKELMRRLLAEQIAFYCPLICKRRRSPAGRTRETYLPLFSGYVFAVADEDERVACLATNCVARCVEVPDGVGLRNDLARIRRLLGAGEPVSEESQIRSGSWVRIRGGALDGLEGTVVRRSGETRFVVSVDFLQRGASMVVDELNLELAG